MCFLTFDFELCEKLWQMLQVCPRSVLTMYFLKSSGVCRSREPPKISMPVICITTRVVKAERLYRGKRLKG